MQKLYIQHFSQAIAPILLLENKHIYIIDIKPTKCIVFTGNIGGW